MVHEPQCIHRLSTWDVLMIRVMYSFTVEIDRGSIPGQVIPKIQKMVLDATLLNTRYYKVWIKDKWSNPRKRVASSLTPL